MRRVGARSSIAVIGVHRAISVDHARERERGAQMWEDEEFQNKFITQ